MRCHRGFLVYLVQTYPSLDPYLKGIHLTLDSWRPLWGADGWKLSLREIQQAINEREDDTDDAELIETMAPKHFITVRSMYPDVEVLARFLDPEQPPKRTVRPTKGATVIYKFGDASGYGFGISVSIEGQIYYTSGQWNPKFSEESSNYRELGNIIYAIEEAHQGLLHNAKLIVFTDNSIAEAAFFNGTSTSKKLFELIIRLQMLQIHSRMIVHFVHVAGK
jgi:hypothetical protein